MSLDIYNDAFKSLSILNEDLFDTSTLGVQKLQSFLDDDLDGEDEIEVIDAEADTTDDLANSYVGKVIVDCNVCHSHIFKDREDIDIDDSGLVNGEDACPYCGEQEGFVIIGQIEAFDENESDEIPEGDEVTEPVGEEMPEEEPEEEPDREKNESLKSFRNRKNLKESFSESVGDGSLADRVLSYLDKLESRGELTEDLNSKDLEGELDEFIHTASTEHGNNRLAIISDKYGVLSRIKKWCMKSGKKAMFLDVALSDDMSLDRARNRMQGHDLMVVDRLNRGTPRMQAEIMKITSTIPTIFVCEKCGDNPLDNSILARCMVYTMSEGLTESVGDDSYLQDVEKIVKQGESCILVNRFRGHSVMTRLMNLLAKESAMKVWRVSGATMGPEEDYSRAYRSADVVILDDFDRIRPKTQAEILKLNEETGIPTIFVTRGGLDSAIAARFPVVYANVDGLTESMNNVKVETDDNVVTVNSDESGKVTVTTEPLSTNDFSGEGEMITPLSDDDIDTIIDSNEMPADVDFDTEEIEPIDEDEIDIDMEEVDEDSVNELGESYLRKVYENVASYKTRKSYVRGDSLILEGVITFTSGKKKTTGFVLEAYSANRYGKVSFRGYNSQLAKGKSSYLFEGRVKDKKLIMESLSYRYKLNEDLVRGKVKRK